MGASKIYFLIGGLVTLLATFLFSFHTYFPGVDIYGIGFMMNIPALFTSGDILVIIMTIVFIIFLLSGIFILLGVKSRVVAIIGSLFAIGVSGYFIFVFYIGMLDPQFAFMFLDDAIIEGILPLNIPIGTISIGPILLLAGGVLGLIGGIKSSDW
ncbi:hypothetical protein LCGC14_0664420 [marine sediment metagenome]|uniref:Uncharacterized protein n=2 Tax=marine sediment metagenome TaxID=412755 RepID=A0A0F9TE52_9ZZZZ